MPDLPEPAKPTVYLLYGDDEFQIHEFVKEMKHKLGDETTAGMNTSEFLGETAALEEVRGAAQAMPFLTERRLVLLWRPLTMVGRSAEDHHAFTRFLEELPPSTALVLIVADSQRRGSWSTLHETHWLMQWAEQQSGRVFRRAFSSPKGPALAERIVRDSGRQITPEAALRLVELSGDDPRQADMEFEKLRAYVNYARPIELADVIAVTLDVSEESVFDYVDALGERNGKRAVQSLRRLLEQQDGHAVFAMVVRQFRLLLQAKEITAAGGTGREIMQQVGDAKAAFTAEKLARQTKFFDLADLETVYRRLAEIDEEIKTSRSDVDTALYTLTAALSRS